MSFYKTNQSNLRVKDYSVSKEEFNIVYDAELDMYKTHPVPDDLDNYYLSDNYISHTDSKKGFTERTYQLVKNYMLQKKIAIVGDYVEAGTLLDIGAGTGDFLKVAQDANWSIAGIEPSVLARNKAEKKGIRLFEKRENLEDTKFNAITMWHVLEHVEHVNDQIQWLKNHLEPDGIVLIAVPNFKSFDAKHYKEYWAAWDVPRHLSHFSSKSIRILFEERGFELIEQKPLLFDSFYVSLLSEQYKGNAFKMIKAFWIGLVSNIKANRTKEYSSHIYVLKIAKDVK